MSEDSSEFVNRTEARARFDRDTIDALKKYEKTGQFVSGEKMDAWLARLEAGELAPPPKPEPEDP
jgi:hypothetical protein